MVIIVYEDEAWGHVAPEANLFLLYSTGPAQMTKVRSRMNIGKEKKYAECERIKKTNKKKNKKVHGM